MFRVILLTFRLTISRFARVFESLNKVQERRIGHIGQEDENVETGQRADLLPYHGYVSIAKNRIIKVTCALKPRYLEKNACKTAGDSF